MNPKWCAVSSLDVKGKKILVRGDFEVHDKDNPRANAMRKIVEYLQNSGAEKIRVIGHNDTEFDLATILSREYSGVEFDLGLRKDPREKANDMEYAQELAQDFEVYVNEAFATSHREHTSIISLPKVIKERGGQVALGLRFAEEVRMLSGILDKPGKRVLIIGGVKVEDKQAFAEKMKDKFAAVLKGGLLPGVNLRSDGLDISDETIKEYEKIISEAEVILAAGVMGKYEDPNAAKGTKAILEAIANNAKAYRVAGGGDIEMAISTYGLTEKFDWISVGGGAMLQYLSAGTLPGIQALLE